MSKVLIKNIGRLQTPMGSYSHKGKEQGENNKIDNTWILIQDDVIIAIGAENNVPTNLQDVDKEIDAFGGLVTPGLVDGHTHLIFSGFRQNEIVMKLKGASYLDILRAGGGILDTVRHTREASAKELYIQAEEAITEIMCSGVTTMEAKSGYGLDFDNEIKMLNVIKELNEKTKMTLVPTFMGAHAVPPEYAGKADEFIEMLCEEIMPYVKEHELAKYCDIFCENSVFNVKQSERYLGKAKELGLGLRIHADEIDAIGGSKLAGEMKTASAEHLISINEEGLESMAKGGTTAMCLPGTSFYLGAKFAPVREMIKRNIPVAIATDYNPGSCPSFNLQFVMTLGYLKYRMTPEEILTAVTINPACALGLEKEIGTIEVGKKADLVIWDAPDMEMLCYRFGTDLAMNVIKEGEEIE
ncbi:MAG: imidazolonepropionase [Peptostreptococcaceae bacterium]|nr:imidazolonepropionase [Peptostreptococcaceae bacterium]